MGPTLLGFLAIALWSTYIGFSRSLTEQLGPVTTTAAMFLCAGVVGCGVQALRTGGLRRLRRLPVPYVAGCGALFVLYQICLYLAVGLAANREQVLEVGLLNYLWPGLTLALSLPILGNRARRTLILGIVVSLAGVFLATAEPGLWRRPWVNFTANPVPHGLALLAAFAWALYSNLSRRWGSDARGNAVPLFFLVTGLVAAAARLAVPEKSAWSTRAVLELSYMAIGPSLLAYMFWDTAMRRGEMVLVASFSHLTPLLSTVVTCLYLGVFPGWNLWVASLLVVLGAFVCRWSITTRHAGLE